MNTYDRHNVEEFNNYYENGRYICSLCGRITRLSDSASHKGYSLICMSCVYRLQSLLDNYEIINMIHKSGKKKAESEVKE